MTELSILSASSSERAKHAAWVSVVTVCFNAADQLPRTMASVLAQTYPAVEYIVIDGGSTDGSVELIGRHSDRLAYWVSEPDNGIYDAMNKAVRHAQGEWIIFLNAGDYFLSPTVLEDAIRLAGDHADFIYGDSEFELEAKQVAFKAQPLGEMWQRISFSHQSLLARTRFMRENPFDCSLKVVSDYEFYFKMYMRGTRFVYAPVRISSILPGGLSEKRLIIRTVERWRVVRKHRPGWSTDHYYARLMCTQILPQAASRAMRPLSKALTRGRRKA